MYSNEAEELNKKINPLIFTLLSEKGKAAYFPKKGIVVQGADAAGKNINATIGIATKDDGTPMHLSSIASRMDADPVDIFNYPPPHGKPALRTLWRESLYRKNPSLEAPVSNPVVVQGITHGLSLAADLSSTMAIV